MRIYHHLTRHKSHLLIGENCAAPCAMHVRAYLCGHVLPYTCGHADHSSDWLAVFLLLSLLLADRLSLSFDLCGPLAAPLYSCFYVAGCSLVLKTQPPNSLSSLLHSNARIKEYEQQMKDRSQTSLALRSIRQAEQDAANSQQAAEASKPLTLKPPMELKMTR